MAAKKAGAMKQATKTAPKSGQTAPKGEKTAARDKAAKEGAPQGNAYQRLKEYFEEAKVELDKVVWPSRKETTATSIAVLILVAVMTVYLGLIDMAFSRIIEAVLS